MRSPCGKRSLVAWLAAALLLGAGAAGAADLAYPSAETVEPLAPGTSVPSATVYTVRGAPVDLSKAVRDTGALLVFYRGGW
jgi:hypothetical protein